MVRESGLPAESSLIEFMTGFIYEKDQKNHFYFGRILSPDMQEVEVLYADPNTIIANGRFFIFLDGMTHLANCFKDDQKKGLRGKFTGAALPFSE